MLVVLISVPLLVRPVSCDKLQLLVAEFSLVASVQ